MVLTVLLFTLVMCTNAEGQTDEMLVRVKELYTSDNEEYSNYSCETAGDLPSWLNGILVRSGPGKFEMGDRNFTHFLDGYAKFYSFNFVQNGSRVWFSSRFLQTDFFTESIESGDIAPYIFFMDTSPPLSPLQRLRSIINGIDNPNTNVYEVGGELVALTDSWRIFTFDKHSLATNVKIDPSLPPPIPFIYNIVTPMCTSHYIKEYGSDSYIAVITADSVVPFYSSFLGITRIHSPERREILWTIDVERGHYMHSFAMSQNYVIIFADPVFTSMSQVLQTATLDKGTDWLPELGTTVYVVRLADGEVTTLFLPPPAVFHSHQVNAYEQGDSIHVHVVKAHSPNDILRLQIHNIEEPPFSRQGPVSEELRHYEINLKMSTIERRDIYNPLALSNGMELPTFNEQYRFRKHCFTYGNLIKHDPHKNISNWNLVKIDECHGNDMSWSLPGHFPSEALFEPNPSGVAEDDGVVTSVVLDGFEKKSYLLVLDAVTMTEVAHVYTPTHIPFSSHGRFFPH